MSTRHALPTLLLSLVPSGLDARPAVVDPARPAGVREDLDTLHARAEALLLVRQEKPLRFAAHVVTRMREGDELREGRGSFWVAGDGRLRLTMTFPLPGDREDLRVLVVVDGTHLWTRTYKQRRDVEPGQGQSDLRYGRVSLEKARSSEDPRLAVLSSLPETNPVRMLQQIRAHFTDPVLTRVGNVYLIRGGLTRPEDLPAGDPVPTRAEVRLAADDLLLLSQVVFDEKGHLLSSLELKDIRMVPQGFKEGTFEMEVPEGVEVEEIGATGGTEGGR